MPERLLNARQGAEFLGMSYPYFRKIMASDDHPAYFRIGRWIRFTEEDLTAWLLRHKKWGRGQGSNASLLDNGVSGKDNRQISMQ